MSIQTFRTDNTICFNMFYQWEIRNSCLKSYNIWLLLESNCDCLPCSVTDNNILIVFLISSTVTHFCIYRFSKRYYDSPWHKSKILKFSMRLKTNLILWRIYQNTSCSILSLLGVTNTFLNFLEGLRSKATLKWKSLVNITTILAWCLGLMLFFNLFRKLLKG